MKIVIENIQFPYNEGCRLLKLKNGDECPFEELSDIWNDIQPLSFKDIAQFENLEQRRVGIICLGIERLVSEVNPKLINKKALNKQTTWVAENGELVTKKFKDTYELYKVDGKYFSEGLKNSWEKMEDCYFVKCKDTSTDREYLIWVDVRSVYNTNFTAWEDRWNFDIKKVNAIQCVAWTIQTDIAEGNIEKIIRQGDCILIKPIKTKDKVAVRHLTEKEYTDLLVAES